MSDAMEHCYKFYSWVKTTEEDFQHIESTSRALYMFMMQSIKFDSFFWKMRNTLHQFIAAESSSALQWISKRVRQSSQ